MYNSFDYNLLTTDKKAYAEAFGVQYKNQDSCYGKALVEYYGDTMLVQNPPMPPPEREELDAVYDALPDWKEEADFRVVAVATDDSRMLAKAKSFSEGRGWAEDFVLLFDKNKDFMRAMNVSVVPHVFVIDGKGKIVYSHTSYTPGSELELLEAIKKCSK